MKSLLSLLACGAWIEIKLSSIVITRCTSLPVCGAWIEISKNILWISGALKSLPARGAWIEMTYRNKLIHCDSVAPRMWSVD